MLNKLADSLIQCCQCSPSCYKWLHPETRRKHYAAPDPENVLDSDLGSDDIKMEKTSSGTEEETSDFPCSDNTSEDDADSVISDGHLVWSRSNKEDQLVYNEEEEIAQESPKDIVERLHDWYGPRIEEKLYHIRHLMITDKDRDNIRAFQLKLSCNMPRCIFDCMRKTFTHKLNIQSEWIILHRPSVLAGVDPIHFNCFINSCMAYTTKYEHFPHFTYPSAHS
ncbi:hypothetical protein JVT61DRAFT_10373 [Boletus reticuloceps]|uniref:Uncharacterized protein n=1 Tax=Boletus reticuloceps TaxID=495285 RepID=A0A8I2YWB9_9AGAM|nr:hypothetical protein JVT61DRAFT_10373 [Boletus reticuloceps]